MLPLLLRSTVLLMLGLLILSQFFKISRGSKENAGCDQRLLPGENPVTIRLKMLPSHFMFSRVCKKICGLTTNLAPTARLVSAVLKSLRIARVSR